MQGQWQGPSLQGPGQGQGLDLQRQGQGQGLDSQGPGQLDKDKDFTYTYLLQVAAKPTIAIKQQWWTQSESSQHMTVKPITLNK